MFSGIGQRRAFWCWEMSRRANLPPGVCLLRMTEWHPDLPKLGEYLATPKGRTAYLVLGLQPATKGTGFVIEAERNSRSSLPADAVIHWFQWHRRSM